MTAHHQQQQPESRNDSEPAAAGSTDFAAAAEAVDKRKKARQRWKILCLVKASDTVADETARKERVQEKVDDWMRTIAHKLTIDETLNSTTTPTKATWVTLEFGWIETIPYYCQISLQCLLCVKWLQ